MPDGDVMHGLGVTLGLTGQRWVKWDSCCGLTRDSWQFWQLTAGKWLICLSFGSSILSVCLSALVVSQAVNPLSEETLKKK